MRFDLYVIGAGGTGTAFLTKFSRYYASILKKHKDDRFYKSPFENIYVIDGDTVEEKNLSRQCFIEDDIGENKAIAIANALNEVYELNWIPVDTYLTEIGHLPVPRYRDDIPFIVSCVDNHAARVVCEDYFNSRQNCVYWDAANEFYNGQIVFSSKADDTVISPVRSYYFPEVRNGEHKAVTEMSCTELNAVSPQHFAVNEMMGQLLFLNICKLLEDNVVPDGLVIADWKELFVECIPSSKWRTA